jgi:signal transduction histidine kinase
VEDLARAAEKVAAGDLSQELPVSGKDEVGRLTRSFNEMIVKLRQNRELEEEVRESHYLSQLGRLSSGVAHEIRNPLNFIGLAVDHLNSLTDGRSPEAAKEKDQIIARIKEEIHRLNELVTNFVTYGRPPELHSAPIRIPEIVEGVLRMADGRMRDQRIDCRVDFREGPEVMADPDMLRRAVLNIVVNAIEAMPNGGELQVYAGPGEDGGYALAIGDSGSGIAPEDRDRIFEPYFTTKASGLGLGLVLTRKIVEAHGGKIVVDSQPGKGTRILILLPGEPAG